MDQKTVAYKAEYQDSGLESLGQDFFQSSSCNADLKGLDQASHNTQLGIELLDIADAAYLEMETLLTRIKQWVVPRLAANFATSLLANLEVKVSLKLRELDQLNGSTLFKGKKILDGSLSASRNDEQHLYLMAGVNGSPENRINLNTGLNIPKISSRTLGLGTLIFSTPEEGLKTMMVLENALDIVSRLKRRSQTLRYLLHKITMRLDVSIANHQAANSAPCSMDRAVEFLRVLQNTHSQGQQKGHDHG